MKIWCWALALICVATPPKAQERAWFGIGESQFYSVSWPEQATPSGPPLSLAGYHSGSEAWHVSADIGAAYLAAPVSIAAMGNRMLAAPSSAFISSEGSENRFLPYVKLTVSFQF